MTEVAPVLFLVFNRPQETALVFDALRAARPSRLYVAADGPRDDRQGERAICESVREIATATDWDCDVQTLFRPSNLGCKRAVSEAIDWFFEHEPEGIILEDDCLPDPTFFRFCSELLERFRDDPSIGMISGDCFNPGGVDGPASYLASRYTHIWGWATWQRAWRHYDAELIRWPSLRATPWLLEICDGAKDEATYWATIFDSLVAGDIDTWDYQWMFCCWWQEAVSLLPRSNLVTNVGFQPNATHTRDPRSSLANRPTEPLSFPLVHPAIVKRDRAYERWTDSEIMRPNRSFGWRQLSIIAARVKTVPAAERLVRMMRGTRRGAPGRTRSR